MNTNEAIARAALTLNGIIQEMADNVAVTEAIGNATARQLIWDALTALNGDSAAGNDARAAQWRCRFRLYDARNMDEPAADSDPELRPDQAGTVIVRGLSGVAAELMQLAATFHNTADLFGLDPHELARRLKALRPTLSRRKGNAVWRVPYDTAETYSAQAGHVPGWLARVDIGRVA
jgi:hypothetical protein